MHRKRQITSSNDLLNFAQYQSPIAAIEQQQQQQQPVLTKVDEKDQTTMEPSDSCYFSIRPSSSQHSITTPPTSSKGTSDDNDSVRTGTTTPLTDNMDYLLPLQLVDSITHIDHFKKQQQQQQQQQPPSQSTTPSVLVSIHREHAEPTFVSNVTKEKGYEAANSNKSKFLNAPMMTGTLKHYRSESDLTRLKNICASPPSNATSRRVVVTTATEQKQQQHTTNNNITYKKTNNTKTSSPYLLPPSQNSSSGSLSSVFKTLVVPQRSSSIRSNKSYTSKKPPPAPSSDVDPSSQ